MSLALTVKPSGADVYFGIAGELSQKEKEWLDTIM